MGLHENDLGMIGVRRCNFVLHTFSNFFKSNETSTVENLFA